PVIEHFTAPPGATCNICRRARCRPGGRDGEEEGEHRDRRAAGRGAAVRARRRAADQGRRDRARREAEAAEQPRRVDCAQRTGLAAVMSGDMFDPYGLTNVPHSPLAASAVEHAPLPDLAGPQQPLAVFHQHPADSEADRLKAMIVTGMDYIGLPTVDESERLEMHKAL